MAKGIFIEKVERIKLVYRILILVGALAVLGVGFVFLVYMPKTEEISRIEKQIQTLDKKIAEAKRQAKELPKLEAEEAQVDMQFKEALDLLPNEKEIPSLLTTITKLGLESHLEFLLFSPSKEVAKDFYLEIPVSIQINGRYHDVATFFDKVGAMARIVNIIDVSMRPEQQLSTVLNTSCKAVTYMFKGDTGETDGKKKRRKKKG